MMRQPIPALLLAVLGALFFIPFLGNVRLFDWDEINFAECAREMIVLGDYLRVHIDFQPFYEKPPFFFWCQAVSMHLFGINEFSARLPNAVCGIITLLYLYRLGSRLQGQQLGLYWALAYLGSVLPHLYFRSGIIDPVFNLFIFSSFVNLICLGWKNNQTAPASLTRQPAYTYLIRAGLLMGLAILTKGPVAFLLVTLCLGLYWLLHRYKGSLRLGQYVRFGFWAALLPLAWFGLETVWHGPAFGQSFFQYLIRLLSTPDAGHGGFAGYHVVVLLVGCFPASLLAIRGMGQLPLELAYQRDFRNWMLILFGVVLVIFSLVQSKIVHYSSLCYFPITYLAATTLTLLQKRQLHLPAWVRIGIWGIGGLYIIATIGLPLLAQRMDWLRQLVGDDAFAQANLNATLHWTGWEVLPGVWLFGVLFFSLRWFRREQIQRAAYTLFGGMAVFITLTLWFFIGKIEAVSQGAAMRYFERSRGQNVYLYPYGYRSYGPYFYGRTQPPSNPNYYKPQWLLHGPVDKDVWFIKKITETQTPLDSLPDIQKTGEENGFVFYKRKRAP